MATPMFETVVPVALLMAVLLGEGGVIYDL